MSDNKTVIVQKGNDPLSSSVNTENEFDPSRISSTPPLNNFNTIIKETTFVSDDKIKFSENELKKLIGVEDIYEINKTFAEGGQGTISIGKDKILNRYVAIKSLKSEYFDNKHVINNFITEAKITAQLDHPSIIPLYSMNSSEIDGGLHISMKLIYGHTLKELIEDTALLIVHYPKKQIRAHLQSILKERLEDFLKVCDAISFAHNKKVLHMDLKPDNIMIGEFHEVYVMDWGIACVYHEKDNNEEAKEEVHRIAGTSGFIAPEVLAGVKATPASDQYALGMILFELITLKPGMTGSSIKEVFEKTRNGCIESFNHRFSGCDVPKDLIAVVKKATALKPENRYPSVSAMSEDIRSFLLDEELTARPDNFPRKTIRLISKHKNLAVTVVLLFLLASAALTIFSLIKKNRAEIESKRRAVKMVQLHSDIENKAHLIDRSLFHIAHILSRFADKTLDILKDDKLSEEKVFVKTSTFDNEKNLPPGTEYSPVYKRNISLDVFNYTTLPGMKFKDVEPDLKKMARMKSDFLKYIINSDSDELILENIDKGKEKVMDEGFPIRWIYVALNNGLMINFPGSAGLPEDFDPRERQWYKNAKKSHRQKWSKPYFDISGLGVIISASKSLYDEKGKFYGIASLDMTFDYITKNLMCRDSNNISVLNRYLIDGDGTVILYNHLGKQQLKEAEENASQVKFKPFPYPQIKTHIKNNSSGQFEVNSKGGPILVGYAPVKTLGWYYIETINLNLYMSY